MRRLAVSLVLALSLIGCGSARPDVAFHQDLTDLTSCVPDEFLVGQLIVFGRTIGIQDDQGVTTGLIWPSSYSLHWSPGFLAGEFVVHDETGFPLATTGRRYKIGGSDFPAAGAFWACADVIPL